MVLIYDEILLVLENGNNEKNFTLNRFSAVILCTVFLTAHLIFKLPVGQGVGLLVPRPQSFLVPSSPVPSLKKWGRGTSSHPFLVS